VDITTRRLRLGDRNKARALFALLSDVFQEPVETLSDQYLDRILGEEGFWVLAAWADGELAGGLTAHTLPMTRTEAPEIFIYDVAVREEMRRKGVGRSLVKVLREQAGALGIRVVFVLAENDDAEAVRFYEAAGGRGAAVTCFAFGG
jgi:aminoglycoside 3-N-acetyltransferase I